MKTITYTALLASILLFARPTNAQNLISVQNGNKTSFYQQVDSAIIHSQNGDTIYIPGGSWTITSPISKCLHLIGVGHQPDSTIVTFPTIITNRLTLASGASNGSLSGIYLKGEIHGGTDAINSYTVARCRISGGLMLNSGNNNFMFTENVIEGNINGSYGSATNCSFFNNVISAGFSTTSGGIPFINCLFKNNIFLTFAFCAWGCQSSITGQYLLLENNIFLNNCTSNNGAISTFSQVSNSTAKNNIFVEGMNFTNGTNTASNNIISQAQNSIFVNQTGYAFNYEHDYHLQSNCPGKNAGTDGTDIGIYGGLYPWKAGSIPSNPHFQAVKIAPTTDANGNLNVNIKVKAQDN